MARQSTHNTDLKHPKASSGTRLLEAAAWHGLSALDLHQVFAAARLPWGSPHDAPDAWASWMEVHFLACAELLHLDETWLVRGEPHHTRVSARGDAWAGEVFLRRVQWGDVSFPERGAGPLAKALPELELWIAPFKGRPFSYQRRAPHPPVTAALIERRQYEVTRELTLTTYRLRLDSRTGVRGDFEQVVASLQAIAYPLPMRQPTAARLKAVIGGTEHPAALAQQFPAICIDDPEGEDGINIDALDLDERVTDWLLDVMDHCRIEPIPMVSRKLLEVHRTVGMGSQWRQDIEVAALRQALTKQLKRQQKRQTASSAIRP